MEWSTYVSSGILVVGFSLISFNLRKGSRFESLTFMTVGLILSNLAFIFYMATFETRRKLQLEDVSRQDLLRIVTLSMAGDLIRYVTWQTTIWVFAFTYWITSIEMPKAITKQRSLSHMNVSLVDEDNSE